MHAAPCGLMRAFREQHGGSSQTLTRGIGPERAEAGLHPEAATRLDGRFAAGGGIHPTVKAAATPEPERKGRIFLRTGTRNVNGGLAHRITVQDQGPRLFLAHLHPDHDNQNHDDGQYCRVVIGSHEPPPFLPEDESWPHNS